MQVSRTSFLKPLIFTALIFLSGAASANQCPTKADLAKGIRVEDTRKDFRSDFSRANAGEHLVEKRVSPFRGNPKAKQTTWYVNGLMPGATTRGGGMTKMVYPRNATPQVMKLPKQSFSIRFQTHFGGQKRETGRASYRHEGNATIKIGQCSYDVWKVHTDTKLADGNRFIWRQYYAPDLDISLRSEKLTPEGRVIHTISYNKIRKLR